MIHYTCDCCKRTIDLETEFRYVVRMEVYAAIEASDSGADEDRDYLEEIEDVLERVDDLDEDSMGDVYQQVRYDLCAECRKKFLRNPLGRTTSATLGFSNN